MNINERTIRNAIKWFETHIELFEKFPDEKHSGVLKEYKEHVNKLQTELKELEDSKKAPKPDLEKEILENFTVPLRFDPAGSFIYDAKGNLVANLIGWGMQNFKDYHGAQNTLGEMFVKAFNEKYSK